MDSSIGFLNSQEIKCIFFSCLNSYIVPHNSICVQISEKKTRDASSELECLNSEFVPYNQARYETGDKLLLTGAREQFELECRRVRN